MTAKKDLLNAKKIKPEGKPRRLILAYDIITDDIDDESLKNLVGDINNSVKDTFGVVHAQVLCAKQVPNLVESPIVGVLVAEFDQTDRADGGLQEFKEDFMESKEQLTDYGHVLVSTVTIPPPPIRETVQQDW